MLHLYLEHHVKEALPIMRRHLGEPYGYFTTETGTLNQFVHLWRYDSMAEREKKREALYRDRHGCLSGACRRNRMGATPEKSSPEELDIPAA